MQGLIETRLEFIAHDQNTVSRVLRWRISVNSRYDFIGINF